MIEIIIKVLCILLLLITDSYGADFFNQRYRGWLWFEDGEKRELQKKKQEEQKEYQDKAQEFAKAREEVEQFAKELEDLKYMMVRYPENLAHVLAYKKKEAEMLENAILLDHSYRLANFVSPELVDHIQNPINLYGRKIKDEVDNKENALKIGELASRVELFLFFSSTCPYCAQLEPVLDNFAKKYGFKVEAISIDQSESRYFKTHHNTELVAKLNLQHTPTIMLVTNDSKISFEFMRGAASLTELEERSTLALTHLNSLQNTSKTKEE
jgi:conjugal transfer pilus assembly protein TraF